jgi:hypothetical protein
MCILTVNSKFLNQAAFVVPTLIYLWMIGLHTFMRFLLGVSVAITLLRYKYYSE